MYAFSVNTASSPLSYKYMSCRSSKADQIIIIKERVMSFPRSCCSYVQLQSVITFCPRQSDQRVSRIYRNLETDQH